MISPFGVDHGYEIEKGLSAGQKAGLAHTLGAGKGFKSEYAQARLSAHAAGKAKRKKSGKWNRDQSRQFNDALQGR